MGKNIVTGIELFAGAGGLALGLEQAGVRHLALFERDPQACRTLRRNRPGWNVAEGDIREADFSPFAGADLVSGGPPCQAFSYAGKRLGFGDTRGTLFAEFARCAAEVRPKMVLFENVRGLASHDGGRTFATIRRTFEGLGYALDWRVLNASLHGVAQKRERIIMAGVREDLAERVRFEWPEPEERPMTLREALKDVPESPCAPYSERKRKVLALVPPGGCWADLPEDVAREYMGKSFSSGGGRRGVARRLSWDEPCLTLTTSPSQKQTERCHPDETRPLSVRECARVQSFPDSWEFEGSVSSQYRQIGNAVPVELARRLGLKAVEALEKAGEAQEGLAG